MEENSARTPTVGETVFIRTVTYHYLGRILAISPDTIHLGEVSWVSESGRWSELLRTGQFSSQAEVEVYLPGMITALSRAAIVEIIPWPHQLPLESR